MRRRIRRNYRKARYIIYRETMVKPVDHLWTFIGAFAGIGLIGVLQTYIDTSITDKIFLIGSFGASAVLIYGLPNSPLAQPRNLIGGHVISAFIGVTVYTLFGHIDVYWLCPALSVALAIVAMQITKTLHPPGGATALIANIGSEKIKALGFFYVVSPVLTGVFLLFVIALLVNNIPKNRAYPIR